MNLKIKVELADLSNDNNSNNNKILKVELIIIIDFEIIIRY